MSASNEIMDEQELQGFKDKLATLIQSGDEAAVRAYIGEELDRLPESMQSELVFELFASTIEEELRGQEAIAKLQEEGLAAAEILQEAKKQLEGRDDTY